ncbi:MAG TPA: hypothetical protein VGH16_11375 [Candidatus Binatia bacterium]|jgi:hypothetical protein
MGFPNVVSVANTAISTNETSHVVSLPPGIVSGDMLEMFFGCGGNLSQQIGNITGWNKPAAKDHNGPINAAFFYRAADGSEGSSVVVPTSVAAHSVALVYRVNGWDGLTNPSAQQIDGLSANADPPTRSPAWGADNNLWLAAATLVGAGTSFSVDPTNYNNPAEIASDDRIIRCVQRLLNAATEDPGAFTNSNVSWIAFTVALRGTAGGVVPSEGYLRRGVRGGP